MQKPTWYENLEYLNNKRKQMIIDNFGSLKGRTSRLHIDNCTGQLYCDTYPIDTLGALEDWLKFGTTNNYITNLSRIRNFSFSMSCFLLTNLQRVTIDTVFISKVNSDVYKQKIAKAILLGKNVYEYTKGLTWLQDSNTLEILCEIDVYFKVEHLRYVKPSELDDDNNFRFKRIDITLGNMSDNMLRHFNNLGLQEDNKDLFTGNSITIYVRK